MGIDDRDYLKERDRDRQPRASDGTRWNDKKNRREQEHANHRKSVPLGSASWISGEGGGHSWFALKNRGHDYQNGRYRTPTYSKLRLGWLPLVLSTLLAAIPAWNMLKREGRIPDFNAAEPFPETGSVIVSNRLGLARVTSHLTIIADSANAVVQLIAPQSGRHAMSVFVAAHSKVTVPAPYGSYRVRLIEGQKWHGAQAYFGPNTAFETVVDLIDFPRRGGAGIDLHRRPDGNLKTRMMITSRKEL